MAGKGWGFEEIAVLGKRFYFERLNMKEDLKEKLIKELSEKIEYDEKGLVKIKNLNIIADAVDATVVKFYKEQLRNLAQISKRFIENASQIYRSDNVEKFVLDEELHALEYALTLAEEKYNE